MAGGHCPSRWQEVTCAKGKFSGGFDISAFGALQEGKVSPRAILQRPMAGSQVPYCPIEKKMSDSWSPLDPNKKKECASNQAAYYPIGVDVFLSPRKIDHIARLLELPKVESSGKIPHLLVVNLQKIIDVEVERGRGFPVDTIAPCRERLKILGRLTNLEDLQLSSAERKLMSAYNEKLVLSRP
ncbi:putative protein ENHANCED DISEASE RESISTANCE 2 [Helianthus annuus]|uniref:Protein ENHANCED DISEASE RESISTANCE 2 C-terminal domain-containing protein n=1 Tax=Helianthus annuus TaxID=4232 RepID=A0A9K3N1I0_HELAN|nr:putative protein ENHANCED DISEASE RESISTANCE 2 [Helianthus annuus]KAJ0502903.1 putative protein ENHANCED DISEASE RESISTANCE 2 [Helianthus annuus]KAJ0518868.1 putative protein ENHANCED DISEASE RESISTANCE 2 [Helianthus annuus]